jgi:hypothetical protein
VSEDAAVQLSEDCARTSERTSGTVALQLASAVALWAATLAQAIAGPVASLTVNATTQVELLLAKSVTVTVMGCEPVPETVLPAVGFCVIIRELRAVQLSED